jgi:TolB-like protein
MSPAKSIMVLPFVDITGNLQNQYFSDGIREDILNDQNKISKLRVISRTTSDHFRGKDLTSGEITREVNARYILEGSVRQEGIKVRISVRLIDAHSDQHLWSENFDRELTGFIGVQGDIARQVAEKLKTVLSDKEINRIQKMPTRNPQAYDHYLRGRFMMNKASGDRRADLNKEGLVNSIKYFEMAVGADSSFALAYAGLADAWLTLAAWGWYRPYSDGLRKTKEYVGKALQIDPDCAEAHQLKACWLIDLNQPINAEGLNGHPYFLSWWYALLGEKERSLYWLEKNMSAPNKFEIYFDLIATNPDFDLLRNDPHFLSIIDRRGLTPYNRRKAR